MCERDGKGEVITVYRFVCLLWEKFCAANNRSCAADGTQGLMEYGRRRGWLEAQDILEADSVLQRRRAAAILHGFLKQECGEADEREWGPSKNLADLYECRVCAAHVAQIYTKGIMEGKFLENPGQVLYFGMQDPVSALEAGEIVRRALDPGRRVLPVLSDFHRGSVEEPGGIGIAESEAQRLLRERPEIKFWDVRTRTEYEAGHPEGAQNVPLMEILESPERWKASLADGVILYCDGGWRSRTAAECLAQTGCEEVYYAMSAGNQARTK